ncbi:MAG TPA: hypothetical protein VGF18_03940 [Candidatus Tumulicola sp.]|jgi:hypothetical protein
MNNETYERLTKAVESDTPRDGRAREAARIIASDAYRWAAIYEVDDGRVALLGEFGTASKSTGFAVAAGALASSAFAILDGVAVVPILGAESGITIGVLAAERSEPSASGDEERDALERCAAIVIALFE